MDRLVSDEALSNTGIHFSTGVLVDSILTNALDKKYDYWYLNLYTVIRNFINSIDGDVAFKIKLFKQNKIDLIVDELADDINTIISQLPSTISLFLYRPNYKKITKNISNYKSKDDFKGLKYFILTYENIIADKLIDKVDISIKNRDHTLPVFNNILLTTHIPLDMCNFRYAKNVSFYESFTSMVKNKDMFYTKYHGIPKKDMSVIPFLEILIYLFGDNWRIAPLPIKARRELYDIAIKYKWNYNTTKGKVISDVKRFDVVTYNILKQIKTVY